MWSRQPIESVSLGIQKTDVEGRVLRARTCGIEVASIYLPSGSASEERQVRKERWMKVFTPWSKSIVGVDHPVVLGGDFNIAHTERDIYYAKSNEKNSGFLPHERRWFGRLLGHGWSDFTREPDGK